MPHGRKRLISAIIGTGAVASIGLVPLAPAQADPDIDDVQARVDQLYHEAEVAQERFNDAELDLTDLRKDLAAVKSDEKAQRQRLGVAQDQVSESILRQYQGEGVSTVGQVVVSDDASDFLGQLSTMSAYTDMQSSLFETYSTEVQALDLRREATAERTAQIADKTAQLEREKDVVEDKLAEAEELLGELEAEERAEMRAQAAAEREESVSRAQDAPEAAEVPAAAASGNAGAAVQYGLAQVGDAYVYGATGEDAFDCSGLTMRAWAQAGVSLPHSSSAQYSSGTPVSMGSLQPGDLVFYYSPISHVGMYIGNGQIVHAANPSTGVQVTGVNTMPVSGAVRPG